MRSTTYIRPLMIPIPLAPKQANVQEEEHVRMGGFSCFHLLSTTLFITPPLGL